jgi:hypothetical protein
MNKNVAGAKAIIDFLDFDDHGKSNDSWHKYNDLGETR